MLASELGFRQFSFHRVTTYTDIQVLESFILGCLFRHATLPLLFRGLQAIAGRDKPVVYRRIPALLVD